MSLQERQTDKLIGLRSCLNDRQFPLPSRLCYPSNQIQNATKIPTAQIHLTSRLPPSAPSLCSWHGPALRQSTSKSPPPLETRDPDIPIPAGRQNSLVFMNQPDAHSARPYYVKDKIRSSIFRPHLARSVSDVDHFTFS
jgi:hypothetical protein